ncbi:ubiquinol-cytochrome c reductase complex assembly factor 3 [Phyllostomus discolor]|uniref:Ubiquinol-cytochrome-c reductase complex assembly factor 3 n=1 Tax=Phyllostomus discolor TaxID=89673 RepID=A0A834ACM8_9CHIR|nr:ubiquinol-cytochrome c reductase complex assembly factor 3 [Phyllostomus discolor]
MGSLRKALIAVAVVSAWAGVGSALFVLVTPGEERVQAMLKEMPGQDPRSREEAARTKQLLLPLSPALPFAFQRLPLFSFFALPLFLCHQLQHPVWQKGESSREMNMDREGEFMTRDSENQVRDPVIKEDRKKGSAKQGQKECEKFEILRLDCVLRRGGR